MADFGLGNRKILVINISSFRSAAKCGGSFSFPFCEELEKSVATCLSPVDWQSGNSFLREMEGEVQVLLTAVSDSTRETRTETFLLLPSSQRAKRQSFTRVKIKTYDQQEANMYLVIR